MQQSSAGDAAARLGELAGLADECRSAFLAAAQSGRKPTGAAGGRLRIALDAADPATTADGISAGSDLVREVVLTYLEIAGHHFDGLAALYRSGKAMFPPTPLVRSIIEHSAHALWVIGDAPSANPTDVLARAYLEEFASCESAKQAAGQLHSKTTDTYTRAKSRWTAVRTRALDAFPAATPSDLSHPGRTLSGQTLLGPEECVRWMFDVLERRGGGSVSESQSRGIYSFLCAGTHPSLYQARQLRRTVNDDGEVSIELHMRVDSVESQLKVAIGAYYNALGFAIDVLGMSRAPHDKLTAVIHAVLPEFFGTPPNSGSSGK